MGNFGYVKDTFGKILDFYASNYSVAELLKISNDNDYAAEKAKLPTNAMILCAENKFIDSDQDNMDEGNYGIVITDNNGNVCPTSLFDIIEQNGGLTVDSNSSQRILKLNVAENGGLETTAAGLKVKLGTGLMLNDNGEICIDTSVLGNKINI